MNNNKVLKDNNFKELSQALGSKLLNFDDSESLNLEEILRSDAHFLASNFLMDYSCLLTIETSPQSGRQIYHLGIIDYLQEWTLSKKIEACWKSLFFKDAKENLSAIPSIPYAARFVNFMIKEVLKKKIEYLTNESKREFIKSL